MAAILLALGPRRKSDLPIAGILRFDRYLPAPRCVRRDDAHAMQRYQWTIGSPLTGLSKNGIDVARSPPR